MKRLGLLDDAFLRLESRRQPLHIGVLMLLEPPANAGKDFAEKLAERLRRSTRTVPPFNRRLVQRRGVHYWAEDDEFDLDHHFAHTSLPHPGRVRELLAMVSRLHYGHLDREYPLWRMHLIEGLEDGRIAVYMKIHHALVDGMGGMQLLLKSLSTSAAASKKLPAPWEVQTRKSGTQPFPVPHAASDSLSTLFKLATESWKFVPPVVSELISTYRESRTDNPELAKFGRAPKTLLNGKVSATRRFAGQSYSTPRIRAIAEAYDATVNDVVLAMCASALRRYLADMGELPERSLTAAVPVSVRRPGSDAANEVAFTITTLATHIDDAGARLRAIKKGMDHNKERLQRLTSIQTMAYTAGIMIPGHLGALLGGSKDDALANVVISHVPGPREPMYWQGAKLGGLYPISLVIDNGALNITLVSRQDFVDFGLIACRKSVPHMQRLLDYLEDGLAELEASIKPAKRARPGKSSRRKAPVRGTVSGGAKRAPADIKRTAKTKGRAADSRKKASSSRGKQGS
jgi:diacylglycerol O-acyltransferase